MVWEGRSGNAPPYPDLAMDTSILPILAVLKGDAPPSNRRWRLLGLRGGARGYFVSRCLAETRRPSVIIAPSSREAESWVGDLRFFLGEDEKRQPLDRRVHWLPPWDVDPFGGVSPTAELAAERLSSLHHLCQAKAPVIVTSADAVLQKLPPRRTLLDLTRYCVEGGSAISGIF